MSAVTSGVGTLAAYRRVRAVPLSGEERSWLKNRISVAIGPEADLKLSVLELTNRSRARGTHGKVGSLSIAPVGSQWERNSQLQLTYQSSQPPFRAALMLRRGYIL
jgi:hypothetical protein